MEKLELEPKQIFDFVGYLREDKTHLGTLADLNNSGASSRALLSGQAAHVTHRPVNSYREASSPRSALQGSTKQMSSGQGKCPQVVKPVPDSLTWAVDALSQPREDLDPNAFPPVAISGKEVAKLIAYARESFSLHQGGPTCPDPGIW